MLSQMQRDAWTVVIGFMLTGVPTVFTALDRFLKGYPGCESAGILIQISGWTRVGLHSVLPHPNAPKMALKA